jgi:hypothetical protein
MQPSPRVNRCGASEFIIYNGRKIVNPQFWDTQRHFYTLPDGLLQVMDLAALILPSMLHESQLEENNEARNWLANHGCGLGNDFVLLTMYKKYSQVLISILNSPVVKMGRLCNFRPLFMFQNILLAKSKFGKNNMHFTSVDKGAKTKIILLGFWKMPDNDPQTHRNFRY